MPASTDDKSPHDGPTRPTKLYQQHTGQEHSGMAAENSAANERFKRNSEALQQIQAERKAAWNQPQPDNNRAQDSTLTSAADHEQAQPRTLSSYEDSGQTSGNYGELKKEHADSASPNEPGGDHAVTDAKAEGGKEAQASENIHEGPPTPRQRTATHHPQQYGRLGPLTPEQLARRERLSGNSGPQAENVHDNPAGPARDGRGRGD